MKVWTLISEWVQTPCLHIKDIILTPWCFVSICFMSEPCLYLEEWQVSACSITYNDLYFKAIELKCMHVSNKVASMNLALSPPALVKWGPNDIIVQYGTQYGNAYSHLSAVVWLQYLEHIMQRLCHHYLSKQSKHGPSYLWVIWLRVLWCSLLLALMINYLNWTNYSCRFLCRRTSKRYWKKPVQPCLKLSSVRLWLRHKSLPYRKLELQLHLPTIQTAKLDYSLRCFVLEVCRWDEKLYPPISLSALLWGSVVLNGRWNLHQLFSNKLNLCNFEGQ